MKVHVMKTEWIPGESEVDVVNLPGSKVNAGFAEALASAVAEAQWGESQVWRTVQERNGLFVYETSTASHGGYVAVTKRPLPSKYWGFRVSVGFPLAIAPCSIYVFEEDCAWACLEPLLSDTVIAANNKAAGRTATVSRMREIAKEMRDMYYKKFDKL